MYGRGAPVGAGAGSIGGSSMQSGGTDAQDAASSAVTDTAGGEDTELSADFRCGYVCVVVLRFIVLHSSRRCCWCLRAQL
jgi:hypothetical protein